MKKVDLIVTAPHIYTMKGEGVGYEEKKALVVDGSKIIDIVDIDKLSDQYEAEEQLDMSHHILLPGFIDAHMHTSCNIMRGLLLRLALVCFIMIPPRNRCCPGADIRQIIRPSG